MRLQQLRVWHHVVVQEDDQAALGLVQPGIAGGGRAVVRLLQHPQAVRRLQGRQRLAGAVGGAVVDHHDLEALGREGLPSSARSSRSMPSRRL